MGKHFLHRLGFVVFIAMLSNFVYYYLKIIKIIKLAAPQYKTHNTAVSCIISSKYCPFIILSKDSEDLISSVPTSIEDFFKTKLFLLWIAPVRCGPLTCMSE